MQRRQYNLFSIALLDVIFGFLGAITFMFIVVDKGPGIPVPTVGEGAPFVVHASLDTSNKVVHNLEYEEGKNLHDGFTVIIDNLLPFPEEIGTDEGDDFIACPNPARHKQPTCIDINAHKRRTPISVPAPPIIKSECSLTHCDSPSCDKEEVITIINTERRKNNPLSLPYAIGISAEDLNVCGHDLDLRLKVGDAYVTPKRKVNDFKWLDFNKTPFWKKGLVKQSEVITNMQLDAGEYVAEVRLQDQGESATNTQVRIVVSTKYNGEIRDKDRTVTIEKGDDWNTKLHFRISTTGNITFL